MPVTKVCKKHYFLFLFYVCVPTLWICSALFSFNVRQAKLDFHLWPTQNMFSRLVNQDTYRSFIRWHFSFSFLCVFWRCHILNRCRLKKPAPHSTYPSTPSSFFISLNALSCPVLKPLGATLTPAHLCLFSDSRWQKNQKSVCKLAMAG